MGWLFGWESKKELIDHFESGSFYTKEYTPIKYSLVGNHHWTLLRKNDDSVTVCVELISHGGRDGWGYKGMGEGCISFTDCPIGFIKALSPTEDPDKLKWRENVKAFHEKKRTRKYKKGQIWEVFGKQYRLNCSAGKRLGWEGCLIETGESFRIPFKYLFNARQIS
ncbi:hypothetical protein A3715_10440 [Oleiphilus sp. HI0009]|nr:hypothetical protein A3715_10440 [Oleiphilus sp. HI0009]